MHRISFHNKIDPKFDRRSDSSFTDCIIIKLSVDWPQ